MGINEGGMENGAMSRKVEITLNSAVSLVQTLQPLLFIPCYKSGGGSTLGKLSSCKYSLFVELNSDGLPPLAYNVPIICGRWGVTPPQFN
jgi:hypothetical protein